MEIESTLRVLDEADFESIERNSSPGNTLKRLVGSTDERPSERIRVILASFKPGTSEALHWHLVEAFYYVISGRGVMKDIANRRHPIGPGTVIYAPPGITGAHAWEAEEEMQLIGVRATTDPERNVQFTVDTSTMSSSIEADSLINRGAGTFRSLY